MYSRHDREPLEKDHGQEIRLKIWLNLGTSTVETSKYCKSELNRVYCLWSTNAPLYRAFNKLFGLGSREISCVFNTWPMLNFPPSQGGRGGGGGVSIDWCIIKPLNKRMNIINFLFCWSVTLLTFSQTLYTACTANNIYLAVVKSENRLAGFGKSPRLIVWNIDWVQFVLKNCEILHFVRGLYDKYRVS